MTQRIHQWLLDRGIDEQTVLKFNVSYSGNKIVIPIYDINGNFLFNKYRKDPEDTTDAPKYTYDKGGSVQLFGQQLLNDEQVMVVICEGEFDAMLLNRFGFNAYSSTGGAGSFKEDWDELFKGKQVYIVYDNDKAGAQGAYNVQSIIPWAKIVWLPKEVGEHGDITDYFMKLNKHPIDFHMLLETGETLMVPRPLTTLPKTKKELAQIIKDDSLYAEALLMVKREFAKTRREWEIYRVDVLLDYYIARIESLKYSLKHKYTKKVPVNPTAADRLQRAKSVPIDSFIEFNRSRFAPCIWHNEKTPSMHYYADTNKVKCFACAEGRGDAIDCMMQLKGLTINEAIEALLSL